MTRFLLSLDQAVDTIFAAVQEGKRGETYIPRVPAARITDVASALIGTRSIEMVYTGIRPGEKLHEILVSEEERFHTFRRGDYYVIAPILPELVIERDYDYPLQEEFSSSNALLDREGVVEMLEKFNLLVENVSNDSQELLR